MLSPRFHLLDIDRRTEDRGSTSVTVDVLRPGFFVGTDPAPHESNLLHMRVCEVAQLSASRRGRDVRFAGGWPTWYINGRNKRRPRLRAREERERERGELKRQRARRRSEETQGSGWRLEGHGHGRPPGQAGGGGGGAWP
jgi:hypothetical protein